MLLLNGVLHVLHFVSNGTCLGKIISSTCLQFPFLVIQRGGRYRELRVRHGGMSWGGWVIYHSLMRSVEELGSCGASGAIVLVKDTRRASVHVGMGVWGN
jgi:hypothetical protein